MQEITSLNTDCRQRLRSRGICVIVPTFNNAGTILDVVTRTHAMCHDVIVVNDGCTDSTPQILSAVEGITVVTLPRNSGKGCALKAGFRKAIKMGFAYAITLDADGQHFPEDIPLLLEANIKHPDALIVGERKDLEKQSRSSGSKFANKFANFWFCIQTLHHLRDTQTGYRLYPLRKLHGLCLLTSRYEAELELLVFSAWHGVRIVSTPVRVFYPSKEERVSHFRPAYDFTRIFILNTCLCFLALCYGLPLALLRLIRTIIYTVYSLLFFVAWCLFYLLPVSLYYVMFVKDQERRTMGLHKTLCFLGKLVMLWHGIPGVRRSMADKYGEDYSRPAMVICNHQSSLDLMAMLAQSPRLTILTNDWVYHNPFFGFALRHAEYYPVTEGFDTLLPKLRSLVERGYSIAVYPEGTRSADCEIMRFRKGAFRIARELQLDILPLVEYAPGKCLPKGGKFLRKGLFHVETYERIPYSEYSQHGEDKDIASWFRRYYVKRYDELRDRLDQTL